MTAVQPQRQPQFPQPALQPPAKPRRLGPILVAVLVTLGVVALVVGGVMTVQHYAEPERVTIHGSETIYVNSAYDVTGLSSATCQGANGYSDITPGQIITLSNAEGEMLGKAEVSVGAWEKTRAYPLAGTCKLDFTFLDVALDGDDDTVYTITFGSNGTRGEIPYTRAELLGKGPHVSFGS